MIAFAPSNHPAEPPVQPVSKWQRHLLAASACICMVVGYTIARSDYLATGSNEFYSGLLLKVGFVLGLAWVAAPQLERLGWEKLRGTALAAVLIVVVLWSIRPRIGAIAAVILIGGSLFFAVVGWFRNLTKPPTS